MSGRRRKEMPPGGTPDDGDPRPPAGDGHEASDDDTPFAPRRPEAGSGATGDRPGAYGGSGSYGGPSDDSYGGGYGNPPGGAFGGQGNDRHGGGGSSYGGGRSSRGAGYDPFGGEQGSYGRVDAPFGGGTDPYGGAPGSYGGGTAPYGRPGQGGGGYFDDERSGGRERPGGTAAPGPGEPERGASGGYDPAGGQRPGESGRRDGLGRGKTGRLPLSGTPVDDYGWGDDDDFAVPDRDSGRRGGRSARDAGAAAFGATSRYDDSESGGRGSRRRGGSGFGRGTRGSESGGFGSGGSGAGGFGGDGGSGEFGEEGRRHAPKRRTLGALVGPLTAVIGLVILLAAGVFALADGHGCSGDAVRLKVAAAPDVAPAVGDIASDFNKQHKSTGGKCVKVTVHSSDPAGMTTVLSGEGSVPGESNPDVWIPDSSLWVALVRGTESGASSVRSTPTFVARSPIVVATSRTFATKMRNQGLRPTWDMLLKATDALTAGTVSKNDMLPSNSVHLQILDPTRSAGGIGAVVMTRMLLQNDPNANAIFTQIARSVQNNLSPTPQSLFASFRRNLHGRAPVVIAPEQAVWKYNRGRPSVPASAIYPGEGMLSNDYPYTLTTTDGTKLGAAALFENALNTDKAKTAVRALGFRTPDGRPGDAFDATTGLNPRIPRALPSPAAGDVNDVMRAWSKLSLRTRMLTLLDVSGSMAQPVGAGVSRMQATAQVAQGGLSMLPDDTDLGLWTFSTNMQGTRPYRTEVPIGPLSTRLGSGTRRQAILGALSRVRPKPDGNTGLYDSVLASFRSMEQSYKPGYYNTVFVLTDGKNDNPGGITLHALLTYLRRENDQARPVQVVFIGLGPDVDMASMQRIAEETNGAAYHAMKPQEVQKILLETIARRICAPECH